MSEVRGIRDEIVARAARVASDEGDVADELDRIIGRWQARAAANRHLRYRNDKNPDGALLIAAGEPEHDEAFATLWSLRDVDRASNMYLLR